MNDDRLQQLLAAERAASSGHDDERKNAALVGHLRSVAGVGVVGAVGALTASTPAQAATAAAPAAGLATGSVAAVGFAKFAAVVVVTASVAVGVTVGGVALRRPATESVAPPAAIERAQPSPPPASIVEAVPSPDDAGADVAVVVTPPVAAVAAPGVASTVRRSTDVVVAPAVVAPVPPAAPSSLERYDLAEAALRAGRFDEAATSFSWWLNDHPADVLRPEASLSLIEALYRAQRFDELIAAAPAALVDVDVSRRGDVERLRAEAFVQLQRCDDADVAFAKARRAHARDLGDDDVSAALSACRAASPR